MTEPGGWPRVAVFGAGAVGCFFGARFAEAGARVTLVARPAHVAAILAGGLAFETAAGERRIVLEASESPDPVRDADLVLFCVKTRDTEAGARAIAPLLAPGAVVVSLQNGVDNAERLQAAGVDALAACVYVACSMEGPGRVRHSGRGDLILGEIPRGDGGPRDAGRTDGIAPRDAGRAARVAAWFERAGVPCPVSADVRAALWTKLAMNCAFNAISAAGRTPYGRMLDDPQVRAVMRDLLSECAAVARAEGVALGDVDALFDGAIRVGEAMPAQYSSTAQDVFAGRPTEIDALNGHVVRRGEALGVAVPVNRAMTALVRLLDKGGAPRD